MTKFYNYINENIFKVIDTQQIINDCMPFIQDLYKNKYPFIYSGRKSNDIIFKKSIRKNRKPMDTPEQIHNKLDDKFQQKFGIRPRSGSLFTKAFNDVGFYGNPFYVFPVGRNYRYIWSEDVSDLFVDLKDHINRKLDLGYNVNFSLKTVYSIMDDFGYAYYNDNINTIISPKNISDTSKYQTVTKEQFEDAVGVAIEKIVYNYEISKDLGFVDGFNAFQRQSKEIMVYCDEVWMINAKQTKEFDMAEWIESIV